MKNNLNNAYLARLSQAEAAIQRLMPPREPWRSEQIVARLQTQGFSADLVQQAIWELIDRGVLRIERNWMLTRVAVQTRRPDDLDTH